jgi:hypothetical protein
LRTEVVEEIVSAGVGVGERTVKTTREIDCTTCDCRVLNKY